jgi:transposase
MFKSQNDKLALIKEGLMILGVDVAKNTHCAQPMFHNGINIGKPFRIHNTREDFESLLVKIEFLKKEHSFKTVIVGLEPTGHYWKPLAHFLISNGIMVVFVNPYHVKKSKELDDNTQTKSDPKDSGVIGRLVRDGRFSEVYIPEGHYGQLRVLTNTRNQLRTKLNATLNIITAIMDEYFPEFTNVFKQLTGKTAMYILNHCPFPNDLKSIGLEGILAEFRKAIKKSVGLKRAQLLLDAAHRSIGIPSNTAAKRKLQFHLEELELLTGQMELVETDMKVELEATGISQYLLNIRGIGVVSLASILGEIGDPNRFDSWKQIRKLAGFNLVENSSGEHHGRRSISKRGRPNLRRILYQLAVVMVSKNQEFKLLYWYLLTRRDNPLKKKQALVAVAVKLIRVIFTLVIKKEHYDPEKVLGQYRLDQIKAA